VRSIAMGQPKESVTPSLDIKALWLHAAINRCTSYAALVCCNHLLCRPQYILRTAQQEYLMHRYLVPEATVQELSLIVGCGAKQSFVKHSRNSITQCGSMFEGDLAQASDCHNAICDTRSI
jgi:hypothetical protein